MHRISFVVAVIFSRALTYKNDQLLAIFTTTVRCNTKIWMQGYCNNIIVGSFNGVISSSRATRYQTKAGVRWNYNTPDLAWYKVARLLEILPLNLPKNVDVIALRSDFVYI